MSDLPLPGVEEAFEILVGRLEPPPDMDKASYRDLCQAILEDAINQVEIRRTGKPAFSPRSKASGSSASKPTLAVKTSASLARKAKAAAAPKKIDTFEGYEAAPEELYCIKRNPPP